MHPASPHIAPGVSSESILQEQDFDARRPRIALDRVRVAEEPVHWSNDIVAQCRTREAGVVAQCRSREAGVVVLGQLEVLGKGGVDADRSTTFSR